MTDDPSTSEVEARMRFNRVPLLGRSISCIDIIEIIGIIGRARTDQRREDRP